MSERRAQSSEFSRPVAIEGIGPKAQTRRIEAGELERRGLAQRFGLVALHGLSASLELWRPAGDLVHAKGHLAADLVQSCVVTLDPVAATLDEPFHLLLGPLGGAPEDAGGPDLIVDLDEPEPLEGDAVDLGELVAQQLSLALDPYPRSAAAGDSTADRAAGAAPGEGTPPADSPFAKLAARRKPR